MCHLRPSLFREGFSLERSFLSPHKKEPKKASSSGPHTPLAPSPPGAPLDHSHPTSREMCSCAEEHMFVLFKNLRNLTNLRHLINPSLTKLMKLARKLFPIIYIQYT